MKGGKKVIKLVATNTNGEQILVTVEGGKAKIETRGFSGTACLAASAGLEAALGIKTADTPTEEMHEAAVDQTMEQS